MKNPHDDEDDGDTDDGNDGDEDAQGTCKAHDNRSLPSHAHTGPKQERFHFALLALWDRRKISPVALQNYVLFFASPPKFMTTVLHRPKHVLVKCESTQKC